MSQTQDPRADSTTSDFDEACRLLDGALDMLSSLARDPRMVRERAPNSLIDELRAWGESAAGRDSRLSTES